MTDEELIARLRSVHTSADDEAAADRLEQLVATNEALVRQVKDEQAAKLKMRDERDAAKIAASNYADFNHTWRKRAERLEAALREMIGIAETLYGKTIMARGQYVSVREAVFRSEDALKGADHE